MDGHGKRLLTIELIRQGQQRGDLIGASLFHQGKHPLDLNPIRLELQKFLQLGTRCREILPGEEDLSLQQPCLGLLLVDIESCVQLGQRVIELSLVDQQPGGADQGRHRALRLFALLVLLGNVGVIGLLSAGIGAEDGDEAPNADDGENQRCRRRRDARALVALDELDGHLLDRVLFGTDGASLHEPFDVLAKGLDRLIAIRLILGERLHGDGGQVARNLAGASAFRRLLLRQLDLSLRDPQQDRPKAARLVDRRL